MTSRDATRHHHMPPQPPRTGGVTMSRITILTFPQVRAALAEKAAI
ncbi:hypothetical protein SCATT_p01130 (plasmid) [Streptantibioticus cattleyicolor NRRL 8057 = DSM 46488]|uniref:Uncharacterized protein n=1 Tax=Streptantibioticus cattleyicolor (strain ATCC 35852 / DSM 46488 / JCM 4925 / NBRC 14057 / NRRL 8057) TaxID=1003195 RepID=G8XE43_STREN|nr:hypothetical protein SCATT_p01130 [Streptantibioticus cattleyicolor NRRL 8057 = DSM 46488]